MPVILISGGTGFIGTNLTRHLLERNYEVIILTREKNKPSGNPRIIYSHWNIDQQIIDAEVIKKADHIIHLAGMGIMDKKWNAANKKEIVESRTKSAELIIKCIAENDHHIQSFITPSGSGFYGNDTKPLIRPGGFIETDLPASDFIAETCVLWEAASEPVKQYGIRLIKLRCGIVLGDNGDALEEYKRPIRFGVAAILGNGKQIMSWIHIDDLCRLYLDALENHLNGVYNAVAPETITQKKFMISLAEKMRNKFFTPIHIPVFLIKLFYGQRTEEIVKSTTVSCKKIKSTGFTFLYPTVEAALDELTQK